MSELSGTVTSTPEEKWGLMADPSKDETAKVDISKSATSKDASETPAAEKPADAKITDEKITGEKITDEKITDQKAKDADGAETGEGAAAGRSWRAVFTIRRIAVGALAVIAVAAIVVAAILGWKLNEQNNIDAAADEAQAAAEQYAVTLTSVSSDSLDQNFAAVLDGATGEFKDMYSQSSGQLRDLLVENKANAQGTVIDSGIKSATESTVEVMLFVDQSVTNTATPDARIDRSRVLMTMEKIDGRWLAAKVDLP